MQGRTILPIIADRQTYRYSIQPLDKLQISQPASVRIYRLDRWSTHFRNQVSLSLVHEKRQPTTRHSTNPMRYHTDRPYLCPHRLHNTYRGSLTGRAAACQAQSAFLFVRMCTCQSAICQSASLPITHVGLTVHDCPGGQSFDELHHELDLDLDLTSTHTRHTRPACPQY